MGLCSFRCSFSVIGWVFLSLLTGCVVVNSTYEPCYVENSYLSYFVPTCYFSARVETFVLTSNASAQSATLEKPSKGEFTVSDDYRWIVATALSILGALLWAVAIWAPCLRAEYDDNLEATESCCCWHNKATRVKQPKRAVHPAAKTEEEDSKTGEEESDERLDIICVEETALVPHHLQTLNECMDKARAALTAERLLNNEYSQACQYLTDAAVEVAEAMNVTPLARPQIPRAGRVHKIGLDYEDLLDTAGSSTASSARAETFLQHRVADGSGGSGLPFISVLKQTIRSLKNIGSVPVMKHSKQKSSSRSRNRGASMDNLRFSLQVDVQLGSSPPEQKHRQLFNALSHFVTTSSRVLCQLSLLRRQLSDSRGRCEYLLLHKGQIGQPESPGENSLAQLIYSEAPRASRRQQQSLFQKAEESLEQNCETMTTGLLKLDRISRVVHGRIDELRALLDSHRPRMRQQRRQNAKYRPPRSPVQRARKVSESSSASASDEHIDREHWHAASMVDLTTTVKQSHIEDKPRGSQRLESKPSKSTLRQKSHSVPESKDDDEVEESDHKQRGRLAPLSIPSETEATMARAAASVISGATTPTPSPRQSQRAISAPVHEHSKATRFRQSAPEPLMEVGDLSG